MEITCPYCGDTWEEDPDLLRIYLGQGEGHCWTCDTDFYLEAIEVEATRMEEE
jgi:hypothetical protein